MKKQLLFFSVILILGFAACGSDKSSSDSVSEKDVENLAEDFLEQQLEEASAEMLPEEETVKNEVEIELDEVKVDKEAVIAQKKEILKEQLKESPNLGKDCDSILKDYEKLVGQYLKGENVEGVLAQLAKWANDPVYNKCKKSDDYKEKFFELEERMYADDDEEL